MKNLISSFLIVCAVVCNAPDLRAQYSFGMEAAFAPKDSYAEVSIPATSLRTIIEDNLKGMDDRDVCLNLKPEGQMAGFQADFDGDKTEEMWLLYHIGPEFEGCNVMIAVAPIGGGKYKLFDVMSLPPGKVKIHPVKALSEGLQMYLESAYNLGDGTRETKGTILAYKQTTMVILTSWTTKNYSANGAMVYQDVRAAMFDSNFDQTKEIALLVSKYSNPSKKDKALIERYVLTLDYVPENLRYSIYDSAGFDKVLEAVKNASAGKRMLHRPATSMEGVVKIKQALEVNPFLTDVRVYLGQYFLNAGKYGDAEHALVAATEIDNTSQKGFMYLGDTYLRLNDLQKAKAAYEKYLAFKPTGMNARRVKQNLDRITNPR